MTNNHFWHFSCVLFRDFSGFLMIKIAPRTVTCKIAVSCHCYHCLRTQSTSSAAPQTSLLLRISLDFLLIYPLVRRERSRDMGIQRFSRHEMRSDNFRSDSTSFPTTYCTSYCILYHTQAQTLEWMGWFSRKTLKQLHGFAGLNQKLPTLGQWLLTWSSCSISENNIFNWNNIEYSIKTQRGIKDDCLVIP